MFNKLVHIGIAVKDLREATKRFAALFGTNVTHGETVADQNVQISFFEVGETHVELTEATDSDSPIARFIEKRGEGVHHLSFEVDDIRAEIKRLEQAGFQLVDKEPTLGADGYWVAFVHPKSAHGVLVEISQKAGK